MATAKIAKIIVETLASIGVKRIYGVPGDSLNGITDAIRTNDSVAWIHKRNEEAAAFAPAAEAHLTGDLEADPGFGEDEFEGVALGPGTLPRPHSIRFANCCHEDPPVVTIVW
jgi:hypothetical protein